VVVVIGAAVGRSASSPWPSLAAYVLVALAFQPVRRHVGRVADRVVYGQRAASYDSLAAFGRQLAATLSERDLLTLVARGAANAFGTPGARASVLAGGTEVSETWPAGLDVATTVSAAVRHDGKAVGRIDLVPAPGRSLRRSDVRLLAQFAERAAPGFHNAALAVSLREQADELTRQDIELSAARRRLVTAASEQRAQVASAIRTRVLVGLEQFPAALDALAPRVLSDPAGTSEELARMQAATVAAIEQLRLITAGVLPPLLGRHGLLAALNTYAAQSPQHPTIDSGDDGRLTERFGTSAESAAYALCTWSVENLDPGSRITVTVGPERLRVAVAGTDRGGRSLAASPQWQHVVDRVEAIGGTAALRQPSPGGSVDGPQLGHVRVEAALPVETASHTASSRSGPNSALSR
jgi:hypothetical protein